VRGVGGAASIAAGKDLAIFLQGRAKKFDHGRDSRDIDRFGGFRLSSEVILDPILHEVRAAAFCISFEKRSGKDDCGRRVGGKVAAWAFSNTAYLGKP
jgi:hypothetical protein